MYCSKVKNKINNKKKDNVYDLYFKSLFSQQVNKTIWSSLYVSQFKKFFLFFTVPLSFTRKYTLYFKYIICHLTSTSFITHPCHNHSYHIRSIKLHIYRNVIQLNDKPLCFCHPNAFSNLILCTNTQNILYQYESIRNIRYHHHNIAELIRSLQVIKNFEIFEKKLLL